MQQLTQEIINKDLKKLKSKNIMFIIIAIILLLFGIVDLIININKDMTDCFQDYVMIILGTIILITNIFKIISLSKNYQIIEGKVADSQYDEQTKLSKVIIDGYNGFITVKNQQFNNNDSVLVILIGNKPVMCYNKCNYYV